MSEDVGEAGPAVAAEQGGGWGTGGGAGAGGGECGGSSRATAAPGLGQINGSKLLDSEH